MPKSIKEYIAICEQHDWRVAGPASNNQYLIVLTVGDEPSTTTRAFNVSTTNFAQDIKQIYNQFNPEQETLNDILDAYDYDHNRDSIPSINLKLNHHELIKTKLRQLSNALL